MRRSTRSLAVLAFLAGYGGLMFALALGVAKAAASPGSAAASPASGFSTQVRKPQAKTRIKVHRAPAALPPTAVRHCVAWYAEERRPSGTVITPRMRCWWARH